MNLRYALLSLSLIACVPADTAPKSDDDTTDTDDSSNTSTDNPGSEPAVEMVYLEPAAIGFEYSGIWNQTEDTLNPYLFPDLDGSNNGDMYQLSDLVLVTLATIDFFSMSSDDPDRVDEICEFYADFYHVSSEFPIEEFNWTSGVGGSGTTIGAWSTYEGYLSIREGSLSDRCYDLDPAVYADGLPFETFDYMHFGVGFAELSSYMVDQYEEYAADDADFAEYWDEVGSSYFSQYIAINHPDGSGGYDFVGYDWTSSFYVDIDPESCSTVEYEDGTSTELCGEVLVDAESNQYQLGNVSLQPLHGYIQGSAWWYEDFPNLDLSLLQEGVDQIDFGDSGETGDGETGDGDDGETGDGETGDGDGETGDGGDSGDGQ